METKTLSIQDYSGYIKCGKILKSPLPNCQHPFILKCYECDEINFVLESFVIHVLEKCKKFSAERDFNNVNEDESQDENIEKSVIKIEPSVMEVEDPIVVVKDEDADEDSNLLEDNDDSDENSFDSDDEFLTDYPETDEDEITNDLSNTKRKTLPINIANFVKCKDYMITLIDIYKNQPILWNKNVPFYRFKDKRQSCFEEMTKELNDKLKLGMTWMEVSDIIAYIYRRHRTDFKRLRRYEEEKTDSKAKHFTRCWFFDNLHFLRPKPVIQLKKLDSNLPDLTTEQVIKIIQIYREFPHLWNSNLIEFICSNKRHAAFNEMIKTLETTMQIKISVTALQEYLSTLHYYFSREKCLRNLNIGDRTKNHEEDYYEHLLYLYDHEGPFNCSECKRVLAKPLLYKIHKANHDDSVPFICSQCNKEFKTIPSYKLHAKRHFEDLEYACSVCDKKFIAYGVLKIHLLTHSVDKPYCCEVCGASYRRIQYLNRHKRRHENQYSHVCEICSKGYYSKRPYEDHMNSHMNIRPHVCQLCGKGFISSRSLKTHAVTHEDARNHACNLCGKTFKLKISVLRHMRTHNTRAEIEDKN